MASTTSIRQVQRDRDRAELRELVIAWATDADTHLATYILELGPERSGAKSRCLCPGCGGPLVAVNNAKSQYKVRPHFRHHQGANSQNCAIVAARMAILRTMTELGWIDLPARARSASIKGLDGRDYEGIASRPPERVRVIRAEFSDCAPAVLHLEDGRQITVLLRGEAAPTDGSPSTGAVVVIEVDDPAVALMDPQQLRERLSLNAGACWHQHWDDAAILDEATSSVDTRTERIVQRAMDKLTAGRTSFVIAHRLSTIRRANHIIVLDHGRIIEEGSHEQLLKNRDRYFDLICMDQEQLGMTSGKSER